MSWILIVAVAVVILIAIALARLQRQDIRLAKYPYRKLDALFTPAERSFLGILGQAVGARAQIFGKVRVADVIAPKKGMTRSDWQKAFDKIAGKHFDFLLCDKNDLSILCTLELNDNSHNLKKRKDRDRFLQEACQSADIPLVRFVTQKTYDIKKVQDALAPFLPEIRRKN